MNETFEFPEGLLGFEDLRELTLTPLDLPFNATFYELQSPRGEVGFLAIDPFKLIPEYSVHIEATIQDKLSLESSEDVILLTLVTLKQSLETSTTNLKAPLLLNLKTKKALQYIQQDSTLSVKHPLKGDA